MNTLLTSWGEWLHPGHVLEEYPRPYLVRDSYICLNGFWDYAVTSEGDFPPYMDGTILVPFSPESLLSRVHRQLKPDEYLWYERDLPAGQRTDTGASSTSGPWINVRSFSSTGGKSAATWADISPLRQISPIF